MKYLSKSLLLLSLVWVGLGCNKVSTEKDTNRLEMISRSITGYDSLARSEIMVLGTFHFDQEVLTLENQESIQKLVEVLADYQPTKIVLELEPSQQTQIDQYYRKFLIDSLDLSDKSNEVYQLGFRLARVLGHKKVYLFDDQTEYIGSLTDFTFKSFVDYAKENDKGFYDRYEKNLIDNFEQHQKMLGQQSLYDRIALMNSLRAQKMNAQRMHMYELRVGIQKSWIGPDWVARYYQRNLRMAANVLKMEETGDRILIIVGDNHKWVLDAIFEYTPDLNLASSWDLLKNVP